MTYNAPYLALLKATYPKTLALATERRRRNIGPKFLDVAVIVAGQDSAENVRPDHVDALADMLRAALEGKD